MMQTHSRELLAANIAVTSANTDSESMPCNVQCSSTKSCQLFTSAGDIVFGRYLHVCVVFTACSLEAKTII